MLADPFHSHVFFCAFCEEPRLFLIHCAENMDAIAPTNRIWFLAGTKLTLQGHYLNFQSVLSTGSMCAVIGLFLYLADSGQ